jgi:glutamate synthase (NADPH/NADH) large chain
VQPAHEITPTLATGAMSHGALLAEAHGAVAQGTNIAGAMRCQIFQALLSSIIA